MKRKNELIRLFIFSFLLIYNFSSCEERNEKILIESINVKNSLSKGSSRGENVFTLKNYSFRDVIYSLNNELDTMAVASKINFNDKVFNLDLYSKDGFSNNFFKKVLITLCNSTDVNLRIENLEVEIVEIIVNNEHALKKNKFIQKGGVKKRRNIINGVAYIEGFTLKELQKFLTDNYKNHLLFQYSGQDNNKYNFEIPIMNYEGLENSFYDNGIVLQKRKKTQPFYVLRHNQ